MTHLLIFAVGMLLGGGTIVGIYESSHGKATCTYKGDTFQEGERRIANGREYVCVAEISAWRTKTR